jgi:alpha-D-ribose 1-methylphosphonate 5-triphosphate synthase subunit PhnH
MPVIAPGFRRPVFDAQQVFRAVLAALSEPGVPVSLGDACRPLASPAIALLLTLADAETPVWLSADVDAPTRDFIHFHTGARIVDTPSDAAFAYATGAEKLPALDRFAAGSISAPERSTTVIVEVGSLTTGTMRILDGPGFDRARTLAPTGVDTARWREVEENSARFPLGIDLLFVCGTDVVGLPRSTRVTDTAGAR